MTTIHTIQDLFRLLAAHPEYREEARRYALNDDLLNLPALFASFAAEQRQFNDEQRDHNARFDKFIFIEEQRQFNIGNQPGCRQDAYRTIPRRGIKVQWRNRSATQ